MRSRTASRADLFVSAATATANPARHRLVRDATAQASRAPQVRALEVPAATVGSAQVALEAIVVVRGHAGGCHLGVAEAGRLRDLAERRAPVGIARRLRILPVPRQVGPRPLRCLLPRVRVSRDPAPAVMARACSNLLELDLVTRPLGASTIARSRA